MKTVESKLKKFPKVLKNLNSMMTSKDTESTEIVDTTNLIAMVTDGCKPVRCYIVGEKLQTMTVQVPRVPQEIIKVFRTQLVLGIVSLLASCVLSSEVIQSESAWTMQ